MSDSIENKLRNISKSVKAPPIPTLLRRPEKVDESLMVGGGGGGSYSICGVEIPNDDNYTIFMVYTTIISAMYCREAPVAGCYTVFVGQPFDGSITGEGQVTDRDLPLTWQRNHPEFDPADPGTWGSVFGPGGLAERYVRFWNCNEADGGMDGNGPCSNGYDLAKIARLVEIIRQLYIAKCGFAVSSAGACCAPAGEFGGFTCTEVAGTNNCQGNFYPGQSCQQIGGNNCGLAPNPLQQNPNEQKMRNRDEQKKVAGELIKQLRLFTKK